MAFKMSSIFITILCVSLTVNCQLDTHDHHHHHDDHDHMDHHHNHDHLDDHHHDHDHGHDHLDDHHHHHEEKPSFKYSREANENFKKPDETINQKKPVDHHHHHDHDHLHDDGHHHHSIPSGHSHSQPQQQQSTPNAKDLQSIWISALTSTLIISLFPFLILFFIPLNNSSEHQSLLKILLSFASGGLLGDAFLHLIPHALMAQQASKAAGDGEPSSHSHSHGHSHDDDGVHNHDHDMSVGLWVLAGILVFLIIEKLIRIIKGPGGHGHSHSFGAGSEDEKLSDTEEDEKSSKSKKDKKTDDESTEKSDTPLSAGEKHSHSSGVRKRVRFDENVRNGQEEPVEQEKTGDIKVAGYLNLAADFTHNLTDGLAIGASFLAGKNIGYITALTILLHEIPHEIGDFAILIQSGCSKRKAMLLQLITAFGAFTGTFLSLMAEGLGDLAQTWILPFTAGGFIYIATVSVIPELLEGTSLKQSISEIIALIVGVMLMVLIAEYE